MRQDVEARLNTEQRDDWMRLKKKAATCAREIKEVNDAIYRYTMTTDLERVLEGSIRRSRAASDKLTEFEKQMEELYSGAVRMVH